MSRSWRIAVVLVLLLSPQRLWAHAHLKRSDPASGSRVSAVSVIKLWFTEMPELAMTSVRLTNADGGRLLLGAPVTGITDPLEIDVPLTAILAPGIYTLSWSTAASDGHPSRGTFKFVVIAPATKADASLAPADNAVQPSPAKIPSADTAAAEAMSDASPAGHSLLRAAEFIALLSLIGALAFPLIILPRVAILDSALREEMEKRVALLGIAATAILILTALAHLAAASAMANAMTGTHSMTSTEMAMHTRWGNALRLQIIAAFVGLIGFAAAVRRIRPGWLIAGIAALIISVTPALSGHAGAAARLQGVMIANDFLHVVAGGIWLGTLLCILIIGIPVAFKRQGTERWLPVSALVNVFSPIALTAAGVVIVSGLFASWIHLEHLPALWQTRYGQMLLRKLFFVVIVIIAGAYNYKRIQPVLTHEHGVRRLRRSAILELVAAAGVLIFTGFLTGIEP